MKKLRGLFRIIFGRTAFVVLFMAIQVGILFGAFRWLEEYMHIVYAISILLSAAVIIYIFNEPINSSFKMAWIVPVLVIPVFGVLLYIFVQMQFQTKLMARRLKKNIGDTAAYLKQDREVQERIREASRRSSHLIDYMKDHAGYPAYGNTHVEYFPLGEDKFEALMRELKAARHFIFMEYFIVERGYMWDSILKVLEEKVKEGVEVRVMYDGMCCLMLLPYHYPRVLEKKGIRCKMFSPIKPTLSTYQNNRDHRKIVVIDGHTAFTGGVNLADEYINRKVRFGHWKDTAIMLKGDAVQSFTMMFLQMWNVTERQPEDYGKYAVPKDYEHPQASDHSGFVLPYGDSPMDREQVGERVYLDILNQARSYVHIMTPYLILDDEMVNALSYAAKRGIDVKLIMPHIPDKKYAYMLARTFYPELTRAGVKIYEYTPGFVHAKVFVSDDEKAVVGTINLDFRSLYLHFECAAYIYRNPVVFDVERDFEETLKKCSPITMEDCKNYSWMGKKLGRLMRLVAPLM